MTFFPQELENLRKKLWILTTTYEGCSSVDNAVCFDNNKKYLEFMQFQKKNSFLCVGTERKRSDRLALHLKWHEVCMYIKFLNADYYQVYNYFHKCFVNFSKRTTLVKIIKPAITAKSAVDSMRLILCSRCIWLECTQTCLKRSNAMKMAV